MRLTFGQYIVGPTLLTDTCPPYRAISVSKVACACLVAPIILRGKDPKAKGANGKPKNLNLK